MNLFPRLPMRCLFRRIGLASALASAAITAAHWAAPARSADPDPAGVQATARFDHLVRTDFFAGFGGDRARLDRGMTRCEQALAANPDHAEALVWHGAGLLYLAGRAFQARDFEKAMPMWDQALKEMDRAVHLAPRSVGVLIPRGAALVNAAAFTPPDVTPGLLRRVVDDYGTAVEIHGPSLDHLSEHARGELLGGLAHAWAGLGEQDKAREYLTRIVEELPGTDRAAAAQSRLDGDSPEGPQRLVCVGCHAE